MASVAMDSMNWLKNYFKTLPLAGFVKPKKTSDGVFSFSLDTESLAYVYVKRSNNLFELLAADTLPCVMSDVGFVLSVMLQKLELQSPEFTWLLKPEKYQLIQHEAFRV